MLAFTLALFMVLAADQPTNETPASSEPSTSAEKVKADPDRLICRRESKANSRFTTKVCKTAAEWDKRAETARQALADTQQRPTVMVCPPTGC